MTGPEQNPAAAGIVTVSDPAGRAAEAYRALAANLRFGGSDGPARTLLLTSPGPREGKSTILANLAVAAAQAGAHVVAVDGNLRGPALHQLFGLSNAEGVSTLLGTDSLEAVPLHSGPTAGLDILTAGPPNLSANVALGSDRFDLLLGILRAQADLVLLDSPGLASASDAILIAPRVDGVLLILDGTRTHREDAVRAHKQLDRVRATIVGVVLNRAPSKG